MFSHQYPLIEEATSQYNKTMFNHLHKHFKEHEDLNKEFMQISSVNSENEVIDV